MPLYASVTLQLCCWQMRPNHEELVSLKQQQRTAFLLPQLCLSSHECWNYVHRRSIGSCVRATHGYTLATLPHCRIEGRVFSSIVSGPCCELRAKPSCMVHSPEPSNANRFGPAERAHWAPLKIVPSDGLCDFQGASLVLTFRKALGSS